MSSIKEDLTKLKNDYIKETDGIVKKENSNVNEKDHSRIGENNITVMANRRFIREMVKILKENNA